MLRSCCTAPRSFSTSSAVSDALRERYGEPALLDWDGEIVNQSDRKDAHLAAAQQLVDSGHAYWCDCTAEAIERRKGPGGGYDNFCRDRGLGPSEDRVVRFRVPEGSTTVDDVVRGSATFDNSTIDDFVIVRRGGAPIFVLANAVGDSKRR